MILATIYSIHYLYRGWLFPYLMRNSGTKSFSLVVALGGWLVTLTHGYLNAVCILEHKDNSWMSDWRFKTGLAIYYLGFLLVIWHDAIVRNLRPVSPKQIPAQKPYSIPMGGLFSYVTSAGYLSELIAWLGYAIMHWNINGLFIFAISCANLIPRAYASHNWYRSQFGTRYPAERKILVPYVW
jgi:3-oxo-5-alpha-steroid 4-dehydrogenase 1